MTTFFSALAAALWFCVVAITLHLLRNNTPFAVRYGVDFLLVGLFLACLRLLLPMDNPYAVVLPSRWVIPRLLALLDAAPLWGITVWGWLRIVWLAGAVASLCLAGWQVMRGFLWLRKLTLQPCPPQAARVAAEWGFDARRVLCMPGLATPVTMGLFRPWICLPNRALTEEQTLWALRHEITHVRSCDLWIKLILRLFLCLFWWLPLRRALLADVDEMLELRCDHRVLEACSETDAVAYVDALYMMAEWIALCPPFLARALAFSCPRNAGLLAERAQTSLYRQRVTARSAVALAFVWLVLLLAGLMVVPQASATRPDAPAVTLRTVAAEPAAPSAPGAP